MNKYNKFNNITGWAVFGIAAWVFLSTIEMTGSFWDCGEFIAAAYKLQIGHPPGAPLFLMMSRIMTLFAGDNLQMVPIMVNSFSAIASALAVLFTFWTITAIARKLVIKTNDTTTGQILTVMAAGVVGALAFTFTDSFWFSAVEGEVYATSQFFTCIVVWAAFKWDQVADEKHAIRWIILIAYLMGLSIGVHLLNLLCIPALALIYYLRKYPFTWVGFAKTMGIALVILMVVQYGIIAWFVSIGAQIDLVANQAGMKLWTGFAIYSLIILALIAFGIYFSQKNHKPLMNTILLSTIFLLLGYSSYAQIVVRSMANPPMDENNPENAFGLLSYLNREQYGDRPLGYGQYYDAKVVGQKEGSMSYSTVDGKYVPTGAKVIPEYDPARCTVFPRMYSREPNHISAYKEWSGIKGEQLPQFGNNLKYFFTYQMNFMYWRYFMWNFVGRQNDIQGHGSILKGNWISGIDFIDSMFLGPQSKLPDSMKNNKARNTFYFLPLILGLAGLFYHYKKDVNHANIVMLLFIMTGIAIVVYLNQTPYQPRERDYAYAGSFYAFCIWIGIGVIALVDFLKKRMPETTAAMIAGLVCLVVPGVMGKEGWNDHDRSYRYTSRDFAYDYLNSCAPNAVIFTNGDNDTFPLWYIQDVEGVRTDVRIINLSLLNTDWYIDQIKRKAYQSDPVPFSLQSKQYIQGTRDYVPFYDRKIQGYSDLKDIIEFIGSDNPEAKVRSEGGDEFNYLPTKKFRIKVDKEAVIRNHVVEPKDTSRIVDYIEFELDKNYLLKADLMILDLIAHNDWTRPIYFAVTVGNDSYMNLENYFQIEGLAYRFVPIKANPDPSGQTGGVATTRMYDNMMNKFKWGNMSDPRVYLDQNNLNMTMNFRNNFARLSENLLQEGKRDSAMKVLDKCTEVMPDKTVPYNIMMLRIAELYYRGAQQNEGTLALTGDVEHQSTSDKADIDKGNIIVKRLADIYENDLNYYLSLKGTSYAKGVDRETNQGMAVFQELIRLSKIDNQKAITDDLQKRYDQLEAKFMR
ncbi:MAG: DUF2723 domain-containing protein [Bacteroidetes bacterium]|jgi:hypothetical protein|nr:DUF2723 domain-containing protein [Bacteroidota bacterium]